MELEEALRRRRVTQPRMPMDERLPDGRSVMELMAGIPALAQPPGVAPLGPPPPVPIFNPTGVPQPNVGPASTVPPPVHLGNAVPTGATNLERLMAQHATLAQADPGSPVKRTGWGYEELPPQQSPSRVRHAGIGAAQGAIIAGQSGDPWATLAGAAVGAITGGVSPALIQAFQRRQELDRSTGELATEQSLQLRNAQIGETLAQADQRRLEPYLRAQQLEQQQRNTEMLEEGRNKRAEASIKTRTQTAAETNEMRRARLEEQQRHNKAVESKPGVATEEITVGGRKFKVSANTAARILEDRTKAVTKPDKDRAEATIEADLETEAANDHLSKRKAAEQSASTLRAERESLTAGIGTKKNAARIAEIDRQIAQAEKEAAYRQKEADDAFQRARKAQAKSKTVAGSAKSGSRTIEGAIEAFKAAKNREPTAEEIARMKKALGQ